MIRLTRCHRPDRAGDYFRLHLQTGDSPAHPAAPGLTLRPSWIGNALPLVKLHSFTPPAASHLVRLGRGLHPTEKVRLAPAINRKRAYYDVTVSTPKTVTLLALLEPNHPVARSVMQAHMGAVEVVARAAGRMIEPQNAKGAPVDKWLGVLFHHTHTREGDPHLHSHVILPNVMCNRDGKWRAMQVVIAGPNRLKLELLYGHTLATRLRRLGFGPQIVMRPNGLPEIESLQPLVKTFAKARSAVLEADARARASGEGKGRAKPKRQQGSRPRVFPVGFYDDPGLDERRRLADEMRKPKPRAADDARKLGQEAERWQREISDGDQRRLVTLLDSLDHTNPRRQVVIPRESPPPSAREVAIAAARQVPEGVKITAPTIFRAAVMLSGGRHDWNELVAESRARMARRVKNLARIRAENDAISEGLAEARIAAANRTVVLGERQGDYTHQAIVPPKTVPPPETVQTPVRSVSDSQPDTGKARRGP